jgi:hypothetical protein
VYFTCNLHLNTENQHWLSVAHNLAGPAICDYNTFQGPASAAQQQASQTPPQQQSEGAKSKETYPPIIVLNVGGQIFHTTIETLTTRDPSAASLFISILLSLSLSVFFSPSSLLPVSLVLH